MTIKRTGKCDKCRKPTVAYLTLSENIDMFAPEVPKGTITKDTSDQIKAWRKKPLFCEGHRG